MHSRHADAQPIDRNRRVRAGHDVFALRALQVLAVRGVGTRQRVAREQHAGARAGIRVAEHHRLDRDRRAHRMVDAVVVPITFRSAPVPRIKDRVDGQRELLERVGRRCLLATLRDQRAPLARLGVGRQVSNRRTQHDAGEHLAKAPVVVARESSVAGLSGECRLADIVDAQVQNRVHHAGHAHRRPRAHGHQERSNGAAQLPLRYRFDVRDAGTHRVQHRLGQCAAVAEVFAAGVGRQHESGWHRKAERTHARHAPRLAPDDLAIRQAGAIEHQPQRSRAHAVAHSSRFRSSRRSKSSCSSNHVVWYELTLAPLTNSIWPSSTRSSASPRRSA